MSDATLNQIEVNQIAPHPDNPRLVMRADVVDGIAANLNGEFPAKHAIHVRTIDGGYQILSGHHRVEAARKAGIKRIPAWIDDLDDETAFMELVLSNNQGELSPLEIGMHALKAVPKAEGGRGKKGGLSAYAERVGKARRSIEFCRDAADVVSAVNVPNISHLLDKTHHLAAIHAADPALWEALVTLMLSRSWTVADTKLHVKKLEEFDIPAEWQFFLPPVDVMKHYLKSKEFSPRTVQSLVAACNVVLGVLDQAKVNSPEIAQKEREEFFLWLADNQGCDKDGKLFDAWQDRKITEYRNALEERLKESKQEAEKAWNLGKWEDHIAEVEDNSVALLLTDPPYGIGYQSDHRLDRTKPRKHKTIEGDDSLASISDMLTGIMPKLKENAHVLMFCHWKKEAEVSAMLTAAGLIVRGSLIWAKNQTGMGDLKTTFAPKHERILHAVKGSPKLYEREADVLIFDRCNSERHPTEKPTDLLARLIEVTTAKGEIVVDPFGGVASTLVAAKDLGRKYWGCELDEGYFAVGAERLQGEM